MDSKEPPAFRKRLLENNAAKAFVSTPDQYRLASLKDYYSLMPMAQEVKKPMERINKEIQKYDTD